MAVVQAPRTVCMPIDLLQGARSAPAGQLAQTKECNPEQNAGDR
jgi:hypothetical protein